MIVKYVGGRYGKAIVEMSMEELGIVIGRTMSIHDWEEGALTFDESLVGAEFKMKTYTENEHRLRVAMETREAVARQLEATATSIRGIMWPMEMLAPPEKKRKSKSE